MASITSLVQRARGARGAELIEMAMVMPVLLMVLAAIFDFGFLFRSWEIITNAAREGARVGVLPSYSCDPDEPTDIESRVDAYMTAAGFTDPTAYTVTIDSGDVVTDGGTFTACLVRVEMDQQLPSLSIIGQMVGGAFGTVPVAAAAVMRTEDQASAAPAP